MSRRIMAAIFLLSLVPTVVYPAGIKASYRLWGSPVMSRYQGLPGGLGIPEILYKNAWRTGFGFGAGLDLRVPEIPLSFILGLSYLEKGTELEVYELYTKIDSYSYRLGTLSQTGLVKIGPDLKVAPYVMAGYELAFILKHRGQPFGAPGPSDSDLKPDTRKVDFGLVAGIGLEFKLERLSPFIELCYFYGQNNLSRGTGLLEYYTTMKSQAWVGSVGIRFGRR